MLYGEPLQVVDPPPFLQSLNNGEKKVAVGVDAQGNNVVLMGVSAAYSMEGGKECIAIVVGLPVEYISDMLSLDREDALVYSHIIRRDGIKSAGAFRDNYFDRILALMQNNKKGAEDSIQKMADAMNANKDYSAVVHLDQERRHLYCTKLPYSEWFLVTIMPYGPLDKEDASSFWQRWWQCSSDIIISPDSRYPNWRRQGRRLFWPTRQRASFCLT